MTTASTTNRNLARYMAFAFCTADALLEVQPSGVISFATGATRNLFGRDGATLLGQKIEALATPADAPLLHTLLRLAENGQRFQNVPVRFQHPDNVESAIMLNGYNVPDLGGHCLITANFAPPQGAQNNASKAETESGLMNADSFEATVGAQLENPDSDDKLTFIGLTGLPALQGRLTHEEWGQLQQRFGAFLNAVSAGGESAAQLGEDRFGLLHAKGLLVDDVKNQLQQFTKAADPDSIGAKITSQSIDPDALDLSGPELARAVLYTIRQVADRSGNAGSVLSANISKDLKKSARNIAIVQATIDKSLFDIAYQPIVSLEDEMVHHFEALVRVTDPDCPFNTFEFICFVEDVGLAIEFDLAMCRKLMSRLKSMSERDQLIPVAMNISGHSINSDEFVESLRAILAENPELHGTIMFEITETARIEDLEKANQIIKDLRSDGFHVCLDDFGSGEASFEYLRDLEVDFVKIDGAYVEGFSKNDKGKIFLKAMSGLCHDLGMATIAERIETREEFDFLKGIGVAYGQGYLFGRPDPAADLTVRGNQGSAKNVRRKGKVQGWG